jgi:hypothetical protein
VIQINHNMAGKFARKDANSSSLFQSGNCSEIERQAKTREEAFTEYLSARYRLSCSEPGAVGHIAAVETFEAARTKLRATQRSWEEHVAAHHIG